MRWIAVLLLPAVLLLAAACEEEDGASTPTATVGSMATLPPLPTDGPEPTEAPDVAALAENRREAVVNATIEGCHIAVDTFADQFTPQVVAQFKEEECPKYGEWLADDVQDAYEDIGYEDGTGNVWLDDKNTDYEAEIEAARIGGCDHMVNLMEDQSWQQRFQSLTEDGFPSRFCFDLES